MSIANRLNAVEKQISPPTKKLENPAIYRAWRYYHEFQQGELPDVDGVAVVQDILDTAALLLGNQYRAPDGIDGITLHYFCYACFELQGLLRRLHIEEDETARVKLEEWRQQVEEGNIHTAYQTAWHAWTLIWKQAKEDAA